MSLIPYVFDQFVPSDSLFGYGLTPRDFSGSPLDHHFYRSISRPLAYLRSQLKHLDDLEKTMHIGKDGFEVKLDVEHFKPEEVKVKTIDNSIIIEAKHEEKKDSDSSYISRQIVRRYDLPNGFKPEQVVSSLSSDGVLVVKCPKAEITEGALMREIPIQSTGPARLTAEKQDDADK